MIKSYIIGATAALALTATAASAATLSLLGPDIQQHHVTGNDISPDIGVDGTKLDYITGEDQTAANGLYLTLNPAQDAILTYTYLGSEAGNTNYSLVMGGQQFFNKGGSASSIGDSVSVFQADSGLLSFGFGTSAPAGSVGDIFNDAPAVPASSNYSIGYRMIDATSFYVLFDDIAGGDRDFDDIAMRIDVAAVPLPAGGLLLLSALFGAGALRRRQKTA